MKALLIKDLRLIVRQQRATLFMFLAIVLIIIGATDNPMFGILYTVFLLPSLLISTIAYDTFDNGMPFIRALPVSVKDYVAGKYLLVVGGSVLINLVSTGLTGLIQVFKSGTVDMKEILICAFTAQIVILVYSAIVLPVNMCFGTEKGRIILIIMAIAIGALLGGSGALLETKNENILAVLNGIYQFGVVELLLLIVIACVVITGISFAVCVKWMEKKEY